MTESSTTSSAVNMASSGGRLRLDHVPSRREIDYMQTELGRQFPDLTVTVEMSNGVLFVDAR
jgi:hypothetical protein